MNTIHSGSQGNAVDYSACKYGFLTWLRIFIPNCVYKFEHDISFWTVRRAKRFSEIHYTLKKSITMNLTTHSKYSKTETNEDPKNNDNAPPSSTRNADMVYFGSSVIRSVSIDRKNMLI